VIRPRSSHAATWTCRESVAVTGQLSPPPRSVAQALEQLRAAATAAGLDPGAAAGEGEALAAAVAESASQAYADWGQQTGHAEAQAFFDAAHRGRRWRAAPTVLLGQLIMDGSAKAKMYAEALAEVSLAAQQLGEPTPRTAGNAAMAAAAQLAAVATPRSSGTRPEPGESHDLDLSAIDPLTPGAFPGLGATRPRTEGRRDGMQPSGTVSTSSTDSERSEAAVELVEPNSDSLAPEKPKTLAELLAQLDDLIGLRDVKAEVHRQVAVLRVEGLRQKAGLKSPTITRHLVFVGNPGTGKTTVARLVGGIYRALGLLSKGQLVEVDRSELVAGYLGQTAIKTAEVVASAAGGVLFIDEAYSLAGDQYGTEAVDTLVKEMEDRRDDLVLIVAGYPDPMAIFIAQNPGLSSRFRTTIEFDDYSDEELIEIFLGMAKAADYDVTEECLRRFEMILRTTPQGPMFGNGRFARNLLEAAIGRHAWRLRDVPEPTVAQLRELVASDLDQQESAAENRDPSRISPVGKPAASVEGGEAAALADDISAREPNAPDAARAEQDDLAADKGTP
jgi:adenylate kinase family enzyme